MNFRMWVNNEIELARKAVEDDASKTFYTAVQDVCNYILSVTDNTPDISSIKVCDVAIRLMYGLPLTAITNDPEEWEELKPGEVDDDTAKYYSAVRRPSLLRCKKNDEVEYIDDERFVFVDIRTNKEIDKEDDIILYCALMSGLIEPIKMPYLPMGIIRVYVDNYEWGGSTYVAIWSFCRVPNGVAVPLKKFFKITYNDGVRELKAISFGDFHMARTIAHNSDQND